MCQKHWQQTTVGTLVHELIYITATYAMNKLSNVCNSCRM